jgi:hypothetical protein
MCTQSFIGGGMTWFCRGTLLTTGTTLALVVSMFTAGTILAAQSGELGPVTKPPFQVKVVGRLPSGRPELSSTAPVGLPPRVIQSVYGLPALFPTSGAGNGQIIAIVDAFHDPNALSDLNAFNAKYGYAAIATCTSLSQPGPCFMQADPQGVPAVDSSWALEESLDIEWAHAEAPAAKIVLVEATDAQLQNQFTAVSYANSIGATEVSMSWGAAEFSGETAYDADLARSGTFYTASAGDAGHAAQYPAASPDVISVGGTTLNGCLRTSCPDHTSETAWPGSGGGASAFEPIPGYQSGFTGPVFGASTISALTGGMRAIPDVSFDANNGVSVYDSTPFKGQSGWFAVGGTSVGAPNWAGILAAGGNTALNGQAAIYSGGYTTNLLDITSGTNGSCGTACTAGGGYDLVTGLGSPAERTSLSGVTASSTTGVWAVGSNCIEFSQVCDVNNALILHWKSTASSKASSPNPGGDASYLDSVTARSPSDAWAVGQFNLSNTLTLHWNGTAWSRVPSPSPGGNNDSLNGVAATAATDAWAVGQECGAVCLGIVLHWNGTAWSQVPSPNPSPSYNDLLGVTAVSATNAWAVGQYCVSSCSSRVFRSLILHWDGTAWSRVPSPSPGASDNILGAVAASATTDAWAVGSADSSTLILHWNGTAWSQVPSPNPSSPTLNGVAVGSPTDAWAVGSDADSQGHFQTLILHWNGTAWTQVTSPNPSSFFDQLSSVATVSATSAWAVGDYCASNCRIPSATEVSRALILHWNGSAWSAK